MTTLADPLTFEHGPAMPNRIMLAPLTNEQSHDDGTLSDAEFHWLTMRARGGFGLTMTCAAHVQQQGQGFKGQLGIFADRHLDGLMRLADAINEQGGLSAVQLHHAGMRSKRELTHMDVVSPWDDEAKGVRAMTTAEVEDSIDAFAAAACRAERAGFHGVEIHGAHGYLVAQFLNADRNLREDGYGGSYEGRTRFLKSIIAEIRARTGASFQLGLRLSPERYGVTLGQARRLAGEVMAEGLLDYLDMSLWDVFKLPAEEEALPADQRGKPLIAHFTELPRGKTRLGVAGKVMTSKDALACLSMGADFVLVGKGAVLHHDFARRALSDAEFRPIPGPVSAEYLASEGLSPGFIRYMAQWPDIITL